MLIMYVTGEYSYSQITAFFNMHFIAVGKIVRGAKENSGKGRVVWWKGAKASNIDPKACYNSSCFHQRQARI